jgi:hypothetical protein
LLASLLLLCAEVARTSLRGWKNDKAPQLLNYNGSAL